MGDRGVENGHVAGLNATERAYRLVAGAAGESRAPVQSLLDSDRGDGLRYAHYFAATDDDGGRPGRTADLPAGGRSGRLRRVEVRKPALEIRL